MIPMLLVLAAAMQVRSGPQDTLRYRYESRNTSTIDLTAYKEGTQQKRSTTSAVLSVTIRDTVDGKIAHVVVDSIKRDDGGAVADASEHLPPEMTASGVGAYFHIYLVNGKIQDYFESMPNNLDATAASGAIDLLFPGISPTTKVGDTWADTTVSDSTGGSKTTSNETSRWKLISRDTLSATVTSMKTTEAGDSLGVMTTAGTGTRRVVFDAARTVRSGSSTMTSTASMEEAKIKGVTTATLTRIP